MTTNTFLALGGKPLACPVCGQGDLDWMQLSHSGGIYCLRRDCPGRSEVSGMSGGSMAVARPLAAWQKQGEGLLILQ